ncbi:MAG TPA: DUF2226 domain-containing protein [Methanobacteriaceae archaeon]|nr:DUF2226 domain-containing protein [Methanobacteriaceae archaeon]
MDMPITKPSMVSYADQLEFLQLLEDLKKDKKNGFLRVTSGSEDGYLLFKDGKQVAASYDNLSKLDAIEKIKSVMKDANTLVEIFDVRPTQVSYLMDLNKPYLLDKDSDIDNVIGELKKTNGAKSAQEVEDKPVVENEPPVVVESPTEEKPPVVEPSVEEKVPVVESPAEEKSGLDSAVTPPVKKQGTNNENTVTVEESAVLTVEEAAEETLTEIKSPETESSVIEEPSEDSEEQLSTETSSESPTDNSSPASEVDKSPLDSPHLEEKVSEAISKVEEIRQDEIETEEEVEPAPVDRSELLKKYGIKDIDESDVENLLDSYKGGYLSDDDVEKIELTLMNRVKKSVLGLPRVRGTEVMVFLDNAGGDLKGNINLIMEYQSQGLLSRIMGESKEIGNLKRQVVGITHMEIRKIFREYPEIVDKFDVNVEVS